MSRKSEISNTPLEWKFDPAAVGEKLKKWFPKLPEKMIASLLLYQTELLKFNKALNLISESTAKVAESVHVADSVLASQLISPLIVSDQPVAMSVARTNLNPDGSIVVTPAFLFPLPSQ